MQKITTWLFILYGISLFVIVTISIAGFFISNDSTYLVWSLFLILLFIVALVLLSRIMDIKKENYIHIIFGTTITDRVLLLLWTLAVICAVILVGHLFIPDKLHFINKDNSSLVAALFILLSASIASASIMKSIQSAKEQQKNAITASKGLQIESIAASKELQIESIAASKELKKFELYNEQLSQLLFIQTTFLRLNHRLTELIVSDSFDDDLKYIKELWNNILVDKYSIHFVDYNAEEVIGYHEFSDKLYQIDKLLFFMNSSDPKILSGAMRTIQDSIKKITPLIKTKIETIEEHLKIKKPPNISLMEMIEDKAKRLKENNA